MSTDDKPKASLTSSLKTPNVPRRKNFGRSSSAMDGKDSTGFDSRIGISRFASVQVGDETTDFLETGSWIGGNLTEDDANTGLEMEQEKVETGAERVWARLCYFPQLLLASIISSLVYVPFLISVVGQSVWTSKPVDPAQWMEELWPESWYFGGAVGVLLLFGPFAFFAAPAPLSGGWMVAGWVFVSFVVVLQVATLYYASLRPTLCVVVKSDARFIVGMPMLVDLECSKVNAQVVPEDVASNREGGGGGGRVFAEDEEYPSVFASPHSTHERLRRARTAHPAIGPNLFGSSAQDLRLLQNVAKEVVEEVDEVEEEDEDEEGGRKESKDGPPCLEDGDVDNVRVVHDDKALFGSRNSDSDGDAKEDGGFVVHVRTEDSATKRTEESVTKRTEKSATKDKDMLQEADKVMDEVVRESRMLEDGVEEDSKAIEESEMNKDSRRTRSRTEHDSKPSLRDLRLLNDSRRFQQNHFASNSPSSPQQSFQRTNSSPSSRQPPKRRHSVDLGRPSRRMPSGRIETSHSLQFAVDHTEASGAVLQTPDQQHANRLLHKWRRQKRAQEWADARASRFPCIVLPITLLTWRNWLFVAILLFEFAQFFVLTIISSPNLVKSIAWAFETPLLQAAASVQQFVFTFGFDAWMVDDDATSGAFVVGVGTAVIYTILCGLFIALNLSVRSWLAPILFSLLAGGILPTITSLLVYVVYTSPHPGRVVTALAALSYYSSTAVFVSIYRSDDAAISKDEARKIPIFLGAERVLKTIISMLVVVLKSSPLTRSIFLFITCASILIATLFGRPMSIDPINEIRVIFFALVTYIAALAVTAEIINEPMQWFATAIFVGVIFGLVCLTLSTIALPGGFVGLIFPDGGRCPTRLYRVVNVDRPRPVVERGALPPVFLCASCCLPVGSIDAREYRKLQRARFRGLLPSAPRHVQNSHEASVSNKARSILTDDGSVTGIDGASAPVLVATMSSPAMGKLRKDTADT